MVKTNPNSLLKKYKKREKRKTWRSKEAGDKLNRFLYNSIERKPFFSKKIDEYLNNQIISILNNKFRDLGKVKRYKNKIFCAQNCTKANIKIEKTRSIYNHSCLQCLRGIQKMPDKCFNIYKRRGRNHNR